MGKLGRYLRELQYCFQVGAGVSDKVRLAVNTIRFHASNAGGASADANNRSVGSYALRLDGEGREVSLRTFGGDIFIFHEVLLDEAYSIPPEWCPSPSVIVDLGANVGLTTLYLAAVFGDATFVCVEPNPMNLVLLRKNVSFLGDRVRIVEGAVSSQSGTMAFETTGVAYNSKLSDNPEADFEVTTYSMPDLLESLGIDRIDLLKIDIEGAERDLLRADTGWLDAVGTVLIELHGDYSVSDFAADVSPHGFETYSPGQEFGNNVLAAVRTDTAPEATAAPRGSSKVA